jgi:ubiquitin thioesterase protein OTUB1
MLTASLAAIGFSYFEKLVVAGNQAIVEGEITRLVSFNQMLPSREGYDCWKESANECINLLREVSDAMSNPVVALHIIIQRWNDVGSTNAIIFYFRMLSATFLKMNGATYDASPADNQGVAASFNTGIHLLGTERKHGPHGSR